jgi:hypothetical protein
MNINKKRTLPNDNLKEIKISMLSDYGKDRFIRSTLALKCIGVRELPIACGDWVSQNNLHIQQGMLKI